jgi:gamma-glutamylaminecyclotransferase
LAPSSAASALDGARYLGAFRTVERYPMLVAGEWFAPMMLPQPRRGERVAGELYEVTDADLAMIDRIESIGVPGHLRQMITVEKLDGTAWTEAFVYMKSPELAVPAHSGLLADYQDRRFVPPNERTQLWPGSGTLKPDTSWSVTERVDDERECR